MGKNWTRWTPAMNKFLGDNYEWIGDTHLAAMFEERFPKNHPWTKKHLEKRRMYLKLVRTIEQRRIIHWINNQDDRHKKSWDVRGRMQENEVRSWNGRKYIKINGEVLLYNRHLVKAKKGQIVRAYEGGLEIITQQENQRRNAELRAALPPELKDTVKALNQLKKILYGKENSGSTRDAL
jgi:hypothetical protein